MWDYTVNWAERIAARRILSACVPKFSCLSHLHRRSYIRNMHAMLQVGKQYKNFVYYIIYYKDHVSHFISCGSP